MTKAKVTTKATTSKANAGKTSPAKDTKTTAQKASATGKNAKADNKVEAKEEKVTKPATSSKNQKAGAKEENSTKPANTEEKVGAGDFERTLYTKEDIASAYASIRKCKATEAKEAVEAVLQAIINVSERLEVGINKKGKYDSDILQLTGVLSIDSAFHKAKIGWNNQTGKKNPIPAKFHTRICAGSVLKDSIDKKSNATLAKLNKKKK